MEAPQDETGRNAPAMDLQRLLRSVLAYWFVILGCTVVFALVGWYFESSKPDVFTSTAQIVASPLSEGDRPSDFATVYLTLLKSDRVLEKTTQRMIEEGILPEGTPASGQGLSAHVELTGGRGEPTSVAVLTLTSSAPTPAEATARVNAWADAFVEESRSMLRGSGRGIESVLEEELTKVRSGLKEAEGERDAVVNRFDQAELDLEEQWEQRIASARAAFEETSQRFHEQTLADLEKILNDRLAELGLEEPAAEEMWRSRFTDLIHVYWRMAATPRFLTLETAPSSESLSELLAEGKLDSIANASFESEEANPLYEFYTREAARRASELELEAGDDWHAVPEMLIDFEALAFQRSEALDAMRRQLRQSLDAMRREQTVRARALIRDRAEELRELGRRIQDLDDQEERLAQQINSARVESLLDQSKLVDLASRASVPRSESRRVALVTSAWTFMGFFLGLAVALVTSFSSVSSKKRPAADE